MTLEAIQPYCQQIRANKKVHDELIQIADPTKLSPDNLRTITDHLDRVFRSDTNLTDKDPAVRDIHLAYFKAKQQLHPNSDESKKVFIDAIQNILKTEGFIGELKGQDAKLAAGPTGSMWMQVDPAKKVYINIGAPSAQSITYYERTSPPTNAPKADPIGGLEVKLTKIGPEHANDQVSWEQFSALYNACGRSSSWWPTADRDWKAKELFSKLDNYIIYHNGKPVGFTSIDRQPEGEQPNTVKAVYIGIIPSMRGKGVGSYLFDQQMKHAWEGGTKRVIFDTATEHDHMISRDGGTIPAATFFSEQRGFTKYKEESCSPDTKGITLNQLNLKNFWAHQPANELEVLERLFPCEFGREVAQLVA